MSKNLWLWLALLALFGYVMWKRGGDLSASDAHQLVKDGARLVDVRTPQEFSAGHIEGAVNIPLQELDTRMGELGNKDGQIVLYCRSGNRSAQAAQRLKGAGFSAVHNLGAMSRW